MAMNTIKRINKAGENRAGVPPCIWSEVGVISTRSCTRRLECERCLFDQNMTDFFVNDLSAVPAVPQAA
jgi:hypothetical protein